MMRSKGGGGRCTEVVASSIGNDTSIMPDQIVKVLVPTRTF